MRADLILVITMAFAKRLQKGLSAIVTVIMMEKLASVSIIQCKFVCLCVYVFMCFNFTKTIQSTEYNQIIQKICVCNFCVNCFYLERPLFSSAVCDMLSYQH